MFSCNFSNIIIKNNKLCLNFYRRFTEGSPNLVKVFKNLNDAINKNQLVNFSFDFNKYINSGTICGRDFEKSSYPLESDILLKCVDDKTNISSLDPKFYQQESDTDICRENKQLIVSSLINLLGLKSKNYNLVSFLCDSLNVIIEDLSFTEVYGLINRILKSEFGDCPIDDKIYSLFQALLNRINYFLTEILSNDTGIVKVNELPKYAKLDIKTKFDHGIGIDLKSSNHLENLWQLWYKLTKQRKSEYRYTISLLLSVLEQQTEMIFKFDLGRVTRSLDTLVGDSKVFSKLDERNILKLLKRFCFILSDFNNQQDLNLYIKRNNMTPIQVKKLFCNLSRLSKTSPRVLLDLMKIDKSYLAFENFVKISRVIFNNEFSKVDFTNLTVSPNQLESYNETPVREYVNENLEKVRLDLSRFYLKILSYNVDILKVLDYIRLEETKLDLTVSSRVNECDGLRSQLIGFSLELISNICLKNEDLILCEARNMYYLLLSSYLTTSSTDSESNGNKSLLLEKVVDKVCTNSNYLIGNCSDPSSLERKDHLNGSIDTKKLSIKSVQYLLYCDKISNFLKELMMISENYKDCQNYKYSKDFKNYPNDEYCDEAENHEIKRNYEENKIYENCKNFKDLKDYENYVNKVLQDMGNCGYYKSLSSINLVCNRLAEKLLGNFKYFISVEKNYGLITLYVTLMNKYNLLSLEVYSEFLEKIGSIFTKNLDENLNLSFNGNLNENFNVNLDKNIDGNLGNWNDWKIHEVSMLCDLFSRTYPLLSSNSSSNLANSNSLLSNNSISNSTNSYSSFSNSSNNNSNNNAFNSNSNFTYFNSSSDSNLTDFITTSNSTFNSSSNLVNLNSNLTNGNYISNSTNSTSNSTSSLSINTTTSILNKRFVHLVINILNSLSDHYLVNSKSNFLGNREFISLINCLNLYFHYYNTTYSNNTNLLNKIRDEIESRIDDMNFKQLVKILKLNNICIDQQLQQHILNRIFNLKHLGDISFLLDLHSHQHLISNILSKYNVKVVDHKQILFDKLLKTKYLNKLSKFNFDSTYATQPTLDILSKYL